MVTVGKLLKEGTELLAGAGIGTPRLDAEVLLYNVLKVDRLHLHMYPEKEISKEEEALFWTYMAQRKNHMPVQYIIKKQEFMGLDFFVEEGVLIPRGDTEILVEKAIEIYKEKFEPQKVRIMDIGTGSGAIVVSLAKFIESSILTAIDISPKAFEVAKKNAAHHGVDHKIAFYLGSLFEALYGKDEHKEYDFIVSNPPYIPKAVVDTLDAGVKDYEPHLALDGGADGLDFYREITLGAKEYLKSGGWLLFEIGYDQGESVSELLIANDLKEVQVRKDLAGLDRVVLGKKQ